MAVLFVPARFARDAMIEAADAGIRLVVCVTEGIPVRDMAEVTAHLARRGYAARRPQRAGADHAAALQRRHHAGRRLHPGGVGLVSRSGTLTYEVVHELTQAGIGQSTVVGMGGDPIHGVGFLECLELFEADRRDRGRRAHR